VGSIGPNYKKRSYLLPKGDKKIGQGIEPQPPRIAVRVNGNIRADRVEVLDESGERIGIFTLAEALDLARGDGVDLVEIDGQRIPAVCVLIDFGKFRFQCREGRLPKKWKT